MSEQEVQACVAAAGGPLGHDAPDDNPARKLQTKESVPMPATVGKKAPHFEAAAFLDGGFKNVKLSDYAGKWVFLCFYPGDFTFV